MLSEEDEKEQRLSNRIKCVNCYYFDKETKYCREGSIRSYRPPTPEVYHRCEFYREREEKKKRTQEGVTQVKEALKNTESWPDRMKREKIEKEKNKEQERLQKRQREEQLLKDYNYKDEN